LSTELGFENRGLKRTPAQKVRLRQAVLSQYVAPSSRLSCFQEGAKSEEEMATTTIQFGTFYKNTANPIIAARNPPTGLTSELPAPPPVALGVGDTEELPADSIAAALEVALVFEAEDLEVEA
jgi:hypothetical protein